jgi:hypothetical protein
MNLKSARMKPSLSAKSAIVLFLLCSVCFGCEKLNVKYISLDNQSDYAVTVELYTGHDDDQGYMIYEDYSISAHAKKEVESETSWIYVKSYRPSATVNMEINGSKIIFTNQ